MKKKVKAILAIALMATFGVYAQNSNLSSMHNYKRSDAPFSKEKMQNQIKMYVAVDINANVFEAYSAANYKKPAAQNPSQTQLVFKPVSVSGVNELENLTLLSRNYKTGIIASPKSRLTEVVRSINVNNSDKEDIKKSKNLVSSESMK